VRRAGKVVRAALHHFGRDLPTIIRAVRRGTFDPSPYAAQLRAVFDVAGGTFVKLGQLIASSPGLFGDAVAAEFRDCLDTGPVVPFADVRRVVENELGGSLEEKFAFFDPNPIGRASIAVVHRARLHTGEEVAVKVLRPNIPLLVATDLALMGPLFEQIARWTGAQVAGAMLQQVDGLRRQLGEELDLRNEVAALRRFGALAQEIGLDRVVVPQPFEAWSGRDVLTMEFVDGVAIDDLAAVQQKGLDPAPLIEQLIRGFFILTVRHGVFHGDIHAGNLLLLDDGRIGVIDWGIVGRLDESTYHFFTTLLKAVLGDDVAWVEVTALITATYGPAISQATGLEGPALATFLRQMVEPILLRPFGEISFSDLMMATQSQVATAQGLALRATTWREWLRKIRGQRRLHQLVTDSPGYLSEFDRNNFLLGKQLMYFERYGRLFLHDRAILDDREFVAALVGMAGTTDESSATTMGPSSDEGVSREN
jgi:predicted unusual protein kinase regulating ubiquinone biosynthesis (AarF/ABC1/UbiB family)